MLPPLDEISLLVISQPEFEFVKVGKMKPSVVDL